MNAPIPKGASELLALKLRGVALELRRKPVPLAHIIPLLQQAADHIERLDAEKEKK